MTTKAIKHLAKSLEHVPDAKGTCFRMVPTAEEGGFKLTLDRPRAEDQRFEDEGAVVLTLAPEIAAQCGEQTLDVDEMADGTKKLILI